VGQGTEQLEARIQAAVPGLRTLRVDADTVSKRQGHGSLLRAFSNGEADCLVGTQMVAKGLDFPAVTTVGIVHADRGLSMPDFRAAERTFQLIAQMAGRAGRGERPGSVIVQAFDSEAPALVCALNLRIKAFYTAELEQRQAYGYPPYGGLLRLLWTGPDLAKVSRCAQDWADAVGPLLQECQLLGPTPAGMPVLKDQVRWHALVKGPSRGAIQRFFDRSQNEKRERSGVRCAVDIDPYSIF
jgi:primosomal protein N' (replication factor Y)